MSYVKYINLFIQ